MPLLAINLSEKLFQNIKELVEKGSYQSPESFIEIAAFNQLALERGVSPAEIIEKGHRSSRTVEPQAQDLNGSARSHETKIAVVEPATKPAKTTPRPSVVVATRLSPAADEPLSDTEIGESLGRLATSTAPLPTAIAVASLPPSTEPIFGQVNRILPLKIACRWLAYQAVLENKWPRYDTISDRLADDAATVGSMLEKWDVDNERKRDEQLATGLPRRGNSASRDRFLSQIIARVTRSGEVYPAVICQYHLAQFTQDTIALTDSGVEFARLENPLIDKRDSTTSTTLSLAETDFLVQHIAKNVQAEQSEMAIILNAIQAGNTTPTTLASAVREQLSQDWSESVFQGQLSGLVARLSELRLLRRNWQGRNVNYELGEARLIDIITKVNA